MREYFGEFRKKNKTIWEEMKKKTHACSLRNAREVLEKTVKLCMKKSLEDFLKQ